MQIANPVYDAVFKYLMEDNIIARLIVSTIIGQEIVELELRPQEKTVLLEKYSIQVYRLDFSARIKTSDGEYKNILIEIQKAKLAEDIMRFRKYLGEQYIKAETAADGTKIALPIITIYFLGFSLNNIESQAIKVNRIYIDAVTGEEIQERNDFIEQLSHNCYIIQIPRLKPRRRNKLEEMLNLFDQSRIKDDRYLLNINETDVGEDFQSVAKRLERAAMDKEIRDKLEFEEEMENIIDNKERFFLKQIEENAKALEEKDKALEEKDKALGENVKALEEKDAIIKELQKKLKDSKLL